MCWERSETQLLKEQMREEDERAKLRVPYVEAEEPPAQELAQERERERELVHS